MTVSPRWSNPTIVGQLVTLRPFTADDVDAAWEMINEPEGRDLTRTTATFTREQTDAWYLSRNEQDHRLDLAIVENATQELAGEVVLNEYDAERETANFRISLRGPAWFGRGLGGEATGLIVQHGFDVVGLLTITLEVLERNQRARRTYVSAGFVEVGDQFEDGERFIVMQRRRPDRG